MPKPVHPAHPVHPVHPPKPGTSPKEPDGETLDTGEESEQELPADPNPGEAPPVQ